MNFFDEYVLIRKKLQRYNFLLTKSDLNKDEMKELEELNQFQENFLVHIKDIYEVIERKHLFILEQKKEEFFVKNLRTEF
jgi:hypothetical protein